jgi:uncharacterized protein DUF6640
MRDNSGRLVLSLANVLTAIVPFLADWNDSHLFSRQWSPHARFHGVVSIGMTATLSTAALWQLWRPGRRTPDAAATFAALIPIAYWGPFFVAPLVPGTGVEDPGHELRRVLGVPPNLLGAAATVATAGLGWYLNRRVRTDVAPAA